MSIGFSVPIVMIGRSPMASGDTIARIIVCFSMWLTSSRTRDILLDIRTNFHDMRLVIAGIVSTAVVYLMTICTHGVINRCPRYFGIPVFRSCGRVDDVEAVRSVRDGETGRDCLGVMRNTLPMFSSEVSSMASSQEFCQFNVENATEDSRDCIPSPTPAQTPRKAKPWLRRLLDWALKNPLLITCWFCTLFIFAPIRSHTGLEGLFGISLLLTTWTTFLALQSGLKTSNLRPICHMRPKFRISLSVACNPVLWTALGLMSYAFAEGHRSGRSIEAMLSTLERNTTFTDLLIHRSTHSGSTSQSGFGLSSRDVNATVVLLSSSPDLGIPDVKRKTYTSQSAPELAAGDVANAILSAGLVCWGLKLWEYRHRLLSSAGFTIASVSCVAALANVVLGPLLARGVLGLRSQAGYDLAFVARSVTLALGAPAVQKVGGDVGLNAAMVVVNGIVFHIVLGLGLGGWLGRHASVVGGRIGMFRDGITSRVLATRVGQGKPDNKNKDTSEKRHISQSLRNEGRCSVLDVLRAGGMSKSNPPGTESCPRRGEDIEPSRETGGTETVPTCVGKCDSSRVSNEKSATDASTIAAGVTVGINAAAMGTAHLYEAGSDAAPYAALAMTVFGLATVGFTMVPQLADWVVARVQ